MSAAQKNDPTLNPTAQIVGGKLILSLPNAINPVVWQMDLAQAQAAALEVNEKGKKFILNFKKGDGESTEIAPFETKAEAVDALMKASAALTQIQNSTVSVPVQGHAASSVSSYNHADEIFAEKKNANSKGKSWIAPVLAVSLLVILLFIWSMVDIVPADTNTGGGLSSQSAIPPAQQSGVPMSADDFLMQQ